MYWVTLPAYFWIIYYTPLLIILTAAIFSIFKRKQNPLSSLTIILTLSMPIIGIINCIEREIGLNEWEHFLLQLQQGATWTIFTIFGHFFILIWFIFFLKKQFTKYPKTMAD